MNAKLSLELWPAQPGFRLSWDTWQQETIFIPDYSCFRLRPVTSSDIETLTRFCMAISRHEGGEQESDPLELLEHILHTCTDLNKGLAIAAQYSFREEHLSYPDIGAVALLATTESPDTVCAEIFVREELEESTLGDYLLNHLRTLASDCGFQSMTTKQDFSKKAPIQPQSENVLASN